MHICGYMSVFKFFNLKTNFILLCSYVEKNGDLHIFTFTSFYSFKSREKIVTTFDHKN